MHLRKIGFILTIAALTPVIANATPEREALTACAQAFVTSLATNGAPTPAFKVAYNGNEFAGSMLGYYNREYTFVLQARDAKRGQALASARCSTDARGAVIALSAIPLKESHSELAAQLSRE